MNYTTQQFQAGQVLRASQLNAMDNALKTSMKSALPVEVNLGKLHVGLHGTRGIISAKGLEPNTDYALQLFKYSKSKHAWEIMWDDTTGQSNFGWEFLRGRVRSRSVDDDTYTYFTEDVPSWMPNAGILQSRWLFSTAATESEKTITFMPATWILDALKPLATSWNTASYGIIGATGHKHQSLKIKAGIMQKMPNGAFQLVGMSPATFNFFCHGGNSSDIISLIATERANVSISINQ